MCHPYARSATERNLREKASSRKPSVTLMQFIQLPLLGAAFSHDGKRANKVKGRAKARANPNMPMAGPMMLPVLATSTRRKPMIGPVHEKLTSDRVNAIRNMESRPVVLVAFESTALLQRLGSVISKPPRKEAANNSNKRKKKMLKTAFVLIAFRALAPNSMVTSSPKAM